MMNAECGDAVDMRELCFEIVHYYYRGFNEARFEGMTRT